MTKEQQAEFNLLARPLIKWLNDNSHPHTTIIITPTSAEVLEGICAFTTNDYLGALEEAVSKARAAMI